MMIGGKGEEIYYQVRSYIDSNTPSEELDFTTRAFRTRALRIQAFTKDEFGFPPPYLPPVPNEETNNACIKAKKSIKDEILTNKKS
ncbi:MAG: hypothetical protein ACI9QC_000795 [Oceanicoccus sp.]|jgi:hypothetical protein